MIKIALPCIHFSVKEREIINEHGFMSFPQFLDNQYVAKGKACVEWLEKNLRKYGYGLVQFAVAPDYEYEEMRRLKNLYPEVNWIFPLHSMKEDFSDFEWIGMPYRQEYRDYDLKTFLKLTKNKKRWLLGLWETIDKNILYYFNGFDTTIPETYSGKYGKLWLDFGKSIDVSNLNLPTIEIFEFNVISLKIAIAKLFSTKGKIKTLDEVIKEQVRF
jgi:hypothetical protein